MKRKLTRASIEELCREMPVLNREEQRMVSGGDGPEKSWDCLFNCMNFMDPSRSSQDYYNEFVDRYVIDPKELGGVPNGDYADYTEDALNTFGFHAEKTDKIALSGGYDQMVILNNGDNTGHFVMIISKNPDGNYYAVDPTTNRVRLVKSDEIYAVYRIDKATNGKTEGNVGYGNYGNNDYGYGEYNNYGNYGYYDYGGNGYNGYGEYGK